MAAIAAEPLRTRINVDQGFVEEPESSNPMTISYSRVFKRSPFYTTFPSKFSQISARKYATRAVSPNLVGHWPRTPPRCAERV